MHLEPEQTPAIVFYPVRLPVRLSELFLSRSHKHHLGASRGGFLHFYPYMEVLLVPRGSKCGAGDGETVEKVTDEAKTSLSK